MSAVLAEWLGEGGKPVSRTIAEHRESVCLKCPLNVAPDFMEKLKGAAADAIRIHLEAKSKLDLRTNNESNLNICKACGCVLRLKVWTPLRHIQSKTDPETMALFHPDCWVRNETTL